MRRVGDYRARGESVTYESVLRDQRERDARDAARAIAPMKPAPDAILLDTTGLTIEAVVDRMARDIEDCLAQTRSPIGTSCELPS